MGVSDLAVVLLGLFIGILLIGFVAYLLQNRATRKGNLFTEPASPFLRILAFIFGLIFGVFFIMQILFLDSYLVIMPILSIALIAYSLGANQIIKAFQDKDKHDES